MKKKQYRRNSHTITIYAEQDKLDAFRKLCKEKGVTMTSVLRKGIEKFVSMYENAPERKFL